MQRIVATVFTAGAVVVLIVCWLLGWVIILTATSCEYRSIHENDRPASYHLLTFSPWKTGAGDCLPSQIHGLLQDLAITRHRVGQAQGVITPNDLLRSGVQDGRRQLANHARNRTAQHDQPSLRHVCIRGGMHHHHRSRPVSDVTLKGCSQPFARWTN